MKSNHYSFGHVFIAKDDGRSKIRILESTPTPLEKKNLGQLFAIMEIESDDPVNEDVLDLIAEDIHSAYYASENFVVETAFEDALQTTNKKIQEIIGEIGEDWLKSFNIVVGIQKEETLVMANLGRVMVLLLQDNQIIDVLDSTQSKIQAINPVKVFSNIVSGRIPNSGSICIATENLLDYLSKEKIRRIIVDATPEQAVETFSQLLESDTGTTNFAAIVISHETLEVSASSQIVQPTEPGDAPPLVNQPKTGGTFSNDSMAELLGKQNQTADLLSSSLWPSLKKSASDAFGNMRNRKPKPVAERPEPVETEPANRPQMTGTRKAGGWQGALQSAAKMSSKAAVAAGRGLQSASKGAAKMTRDMSRTVKQRRAATTGNATPKTRRQTSGGARAGQLLQRVLRWFGALSVMQKTFFVLAIVLLFVFSQGVVNRGEKQATDAEEQQYAELLSEVDIKVNEGKAAVLFDDEQARELFVEARNLLAQVPTDSEAYQTRGTELQQVIAEQLQVANNVITIADASVLLDFGQISPALALEQSILLGASVYAFDANSSAVYRGNLESGDTSVTISDAGVAPVKSAAKASPGTGIVVLDDGTVSTFNPVAESYTALNLEGIDSTTADVAIFGTRAYALSPGLGQILRFTKTDETFTAAQDWITDGSSVAGATSMAIDGDIYVLQNGTVERFTSGDKDTGFNLATIEPALSGAKKVSTDENMTNLYVLADNRIVVYDKSGAFVAQYTGDSLNGIQDMIVDEAGGRILALVGTQIRQITLSTTGQ